jgi:Sulfotransferase domain
MRRELISYPKSGRSRLRYGLYHLGLDREIRFHHDGFEFNDAAKPVHNFSVESRLQRLAPADRVVFLRRDPRDVLVSLYHQVTGRFRDFFRYPGTLADFIRDPYFGAEVLREFYAMWDAICAQRDVLVVRYEECAVDAAAVFARVGSYFGFELPLNQWQSAADASSFENMKRVEESGEFEKGWLKKRNGHAKVRRGKVGGFVEALPPADVTYLNGIFGLKNP